MAGTNLTRAGEAMAWARDISSTGGRVSLLVLVLVVLLLLPLPLRGCGQAKVGISPRRSWATGLSMMRADGSVSCPAASLLSLLFILAEVEMVMVVDVSSMPSGGVVPGRGATRRGGARIRWWTRRWEAETLNCGRCPPRGKMNALAIFSKSRARRRMWSASFMVCCMGEKGEGGKKDETLRKVHFLRYVRGGRVNF